MYVCILWTYAEIFVKIHQDLAKIWRFISICFNLVAIIIICQITWGRWHWVKLIFSSYLFTRKGHMLKYFLHQFIPEAQLIDFPKENLMGLLTFFLSDKIILICLSNSWVNWGTIDMIGHDPLGMWCWVMLMCHLCLFAHWKFHENTPWFGGDMWGWSGGWQGLHNINPKLTGYLIFQVKKG